MGDVAVKEKLFVAMNKVLAPIREKRLEAEKMKRELMESALEGAREVSSIASEIVGQMKEAMRIRFD